jgi:hypothetical protein
MPKRSLSEEWTPPQRYGRDEILAVSDCTLAGPSFDLKKTEDIFRIETLGLEWDIGVMVSEPTDSSRIAVGPDGKKVGIFLLHGGEGDFKAMEPMAELYAGRFGYKAVSMTFPGRLFLDDPSRDWPGDTVNPDGSVRTPLWKRGEYVMPDQYDLVRDTGHRLRYGTRLFARAKAGTLFYDRMAAWPLAFEDGMKAAMRRHLPVEDYSIYVTGHSTGGPFTFMISQRVPNIQGVLAAENSTFGSIDSKKHDWSGARGKIEGFERIATAPAPLTDPFNDLYIRSWRDVARYSGPEALGREGPAALMRLPSLMEEVMERWDRERALPQFKAEYVVTHNIVASLEAAARVSAKRLGLAAEGTARLVAHYLGLAHPLAGASAKPVPNVLFAIAKDSPDHSPEVYQQVVMPLLREVAPGTRVCVTRFEAGTHFYDWPEDGLPLGIGPNVAQLFSEAIANGYFFQR